VYCVPLSPIPPLYTFFKVSGKNHELSLIFFTDVAIFWADTVIWYSHKVPGQAMEV
jgi:hypothetical protein